MKSQVQFALTGSLVLAAAMTCACAATAQEKKVSKKDLPPAVQKTVEAQSANAAVRGFSEEQQNGKTYYEAEMIVNGRHKDVLMDASGVVVEVEEEVAWNSLPADVKSGLEKQAAGAKIRKVESLSKHDKVVAYEAVVLTDGRKKEVQVGPNGQTLSREE